VDQLIDDIKAFLPYGKDCAIFIVCLILLYMEWDERKAKRKDKEKK
jgi:hypothetical protein